MLPFLGFLQGSFEAGDVVEITGVSAPGDYAPIVQAIEVHVHWEISFAFNRAAGKLDRDAYRRRRRQWVEVEGVVHAVQHAGKNINWIWP
jgi:hypothetical protein